MNLNWPWPAILTAAIAYWVLGFLWYSVIFGKTWAAGLREHGLKMPEPTKKQLFANMFSSFVANFMAAGAIAYLIRRTGMVDVGDAIKLGAAVGIGIAATTITVIYVWESKPTRLWTIDAAYHILGCIMCALIIGRWP